MQTGKSAEGEEGIMADSNPRFMWLLRDVTLMPTDRNGKKCHIKDYLLQKVGNRSSGLSQKILKSSLAGPVLKWSYPISACMRKNETPPSYYCSLLL